MTDRRAYVEFPPSAGPIMSGANVYCMRVTKRDDGWTMIEAIEPPDPPQTPAVAPGPKDRLARLGGRCLAYVIEGAGLATGIVAVLALFNWIAAP